MPGGLPEIVQPVGADTSRYVEEFRKARAEVKGLTDDHDALIRKIREVQDAFKGAGGGDDIGRVNAAIREQMNAFRDMSSVMGEAARANKDFNASQVETARLSQDGVQALRGLMDAHGMLRDTATAGQADIAKSFVQQMGHLDQMVVKVGAAKDAYASLGDASAPLAYTADNARILNQVLDNTRVSADGATRALAGHAAAASLAAAAAGRGGGGGGGWGAAAAGAAAGAAGGGGGGGGAGGFIPWAGGGFAAVRFWGMMGAEIASTVVPAVVAAGAATLVGAQGFEQMSNRAQSLYTVNEALGKSLGTTQGQFLGLGNSLQKAQDAATGTVYGLGGAGLNILKSGAGGGFLQLGTNTLDMISRGVAAATVNVTKGGVGTQLAALMGGGTDYLRQFGDIGANLGKTLLNVAPNLPGVGSDLLSTLQGGTGALAGVTGWAGQALGPILAYEAASRWGPALLSGQGLIGRMLGLRGVGGISGLVGKAGGGLLSAGSSDALLGTRLGGALATGGGLLGDAGLALAGIGAPELGVAGGLAYLIGKGITYQGSFAQKANATQQRIDQSSLVAAIPQAMAAISQWAGVPYSQPKTGFGNAVNADLTNVFATGSALLKPQGQGWGFHPGALVTGIETGVSQFWHEATGGTPGPTDWQVAQQHIQQAGKTIVESLLGMQQISKALGVSSSQAGMIASSAGLQAGTAFGPGGHLTATAIQQIANYTAGIGAMSATPGAFGSNVSLMYAMGSLAGTKAGQVNSASDQLAQIVAGGPAGAAALATLVRAMPAGSAKSMQGFLSPTAASAWTAFASTSQPSVVSQLGQQTDWLRNAMAMGGIGGPSAAAMEGYLTKLALPAAAKLGPAALSMLSMYAQPFGGPSFAPGTSGPAMQKGLSQWIAQGGMTTGGYNRQQTLTTEHLANLGLDANNFITQTGGGAAGGALAAGVQQYAGNLIANYMKVAGHTGTASALGSLANYMAGSKVPLAGAQAIVTASLQMKGASPKEINAEMGQLKKDYEIYVKTHADASGVTQAQAQVKSLQAALGALQSKHVSATATVTGAANIAVLQTALDVLHGKNVNVTAVTNVQAVYLMSAAIAAVQSRNVTVTVTTIYRNVIETVTGPSSGAGTYGISTVSPGGQVNAYPVRAHQQGFRVPGWGGGDIWPALLEPGEAVVPKHLVGPLAPFLKAHGVPGFAGGRIPNAMWVPPTDGPGNPNWLPGGGLPIPAAAQKVLDQLLQELSKSGAWKQAGVSIIDGITYSLSGTGKDAGKVGAALVQQAASAAATLGHKVQAAFNLARGVAGAALAGQGYGTQGLISGMNVTPGTGGGTVLEQMQSYLGSEQSFTKDISSLRKQHLSKALIAQMVAAGPVQGDALAQSVLNDYGGVKAVNATWNQIGQASKGLGAQAAMAQYGGFMAPNLKSGTFNVGGIVINVNAPGGGTGNLPLTTNQINAIVREIEAKLLQQARRNQKTGVQQRGKNA